MRLAHVQWDDIGYRCIADAVLQGLSLRVMQLLLLLTALLLPLKDRSCIGWLRGRPGAGGSFLNEVIVKVRVDQACVGSGDARSGQLGIPHVSDLCIELVHQLRRLDKLAFIRVSQLGELVDVLGWSHFQRHLHR